MMDAKEALQYVYCMCLTIDQMGWCRKGAVRCMGACQAGYCVGE